MKRNIRLFLVLCMCSLAFTSCGKQEEEVAEDVVDTTEQVALDDVEVEDYTVLKYNELEVLAYEGDTDAMVMLGRMLEYGADDVKQSFTEAISWYQMASDSGNIDGTCALGYFYLTGTGVEKDLEKASELFDTAIEGGSVNAYVGKARTLLMERDISEDSEAAEVIDDSKKDSTESDEEDSISEEDKAIYDLFYKAQIAGDVDGAYYLGYAYENGIGTPVDYKKAYEYLLESGTKEASFPCDGDYENFFNQIDKRIRGFYDSALYSFDFNRQLGDLLEEGGPVCTVEDEGIFFRMPKEKRTMAALMKEDFPEEKIGPFRIKTLEQAVPRKLLVSTNINFLNCEEDEYHPGKSALTISFFLPMGAYATMAMKQLDIFL